MKQKGNSGPLTLKCLKCLRKYGWDNPRPAMEHLVASGRRKKLSRSDRRSLGVASDHTWRYEIVHSPCGHVFWSRHSDARRLYEKSNPPIDEAERATRALDGAGYL